MIAELRARADRAFQARYGTPPRWRLMAPGRVNLIGEHTDYSEGFVLPMAVDRQALLVAAPNTRTPAQLRIHSANLEHDLTLPLTDRGGADALAAALRHALWQAGSPAKWGRYVAGVVAEFAALVAGRAAPPLPSLDALVLSDVPLGAGLSSSAALEVAVAGLLEQAAGVPLGIVDKARLCQRAERHWAGVPCGIMDQLVSAAGQAGHALLIDCRTLAWQPVALPPTATWLVTDCRVKHALTDGGYARRADQCAEAARRLGVPTLRDATPALLASARLPPDLLRRARHVVGENARTLHASERMQAGDLQALGALLYESHESLRDDFEVSCPELDVLVELARQLGPEGGVYGARMTGGGFGGSTVTLVARERAAEVSAALSEGFAGRTGLATTPLEVRAADGARVLEQPGQAA